MGPKNISIRHSIFWVVVFFAVPAGLFAFPQPAGRVSDFALVLTAGDKTHLQTLIRGVEGKTTAEIFVVTVTSLEGMTVEEYGNKLFNQWGIGKKKKDNGLLVLVCPPERKMRIEVGYGLEAAIPDGLAGEVIRKVFTPQLKKGEYSAGITAGVEQLARFVEGSEDASIWLGEQEGGAPMTFWVYLALAGFFSIFLLIGWTSFGYAFGSKVGFFILWGGIFGGIPLFMVCLIPGMPFWLRLLLVLEAPLAALFGFIKGLKHPNSLNVRRAKSGSGWVWGAGRGSGGSSGGSSSGGGSSGGGSSGGGGASGSW